MEEESASFSKQKTVREGEGRHRWGGCARPIGKGDGVCAP